MALYPLLRPFAFALDAEQAHRLTIGALKRLPPGLPPKADALLAVEVGKLRFPNPVGLAAGFDKNGEVWRQMLGFGFGFVEIGTLTPRAQAGNPKPRLFRLVEDRGVINRLGFNNEGQEMAAGRLRRTQAGLVGINIGANKDSADWIDDYRTGVRKMEPLADYLTVNISSPNTPGLRTLQGEGALEDLLSAIMEARTDPSTPIFLKVAPDLERPEVDRISRTAIDMKIDALIVGNTTVSRPSLRSAWRDEAGGLSGAPLKALALERLRDFRRATGREMKLIAAGGIENGVDAFDRIRAGATLVQLYSAMVYAGPGLASSINAELKRLLACHGFARLSEAIGSDER